MAVTSSVFLKNIRGTLNKELVFKQYGNITVASKYPDMSKVKRSAKQRRNNVRMLEANAYAKNIMADEKLTKEAHFRLNVTLNKLYTSLIREYFNNNKEKTTEDVAKVAGNKKKSR